MPEMKKDAPGTCCGKVCTTPYCPICGKKNTTDPGLDLLAYLERSIKRLNAMRPQSIRAAAGQARHDAQVAVWTRRRDWVAKRIAEEGKVPA
jgi:hypothetical protein